MEGGKEETWQTGAFNYHNPQEKCEMQQGFYTHSKQEETKSQASKYH